VISTAKKYALYEYDGTDLKDDGVNKGGGREVGHQAIEYQGHAGDCK
jgi:hypothetical protein